MGSSRNDDAPLAKVVDLRRWREERDRRWRAAEEPELTSTRAPDRIAWPFRVLALIAGSGFAVCGGFLGYLPVELRAGEGPMPWPIRLVLLLVVFPVGVGMALFGIDLMGRGFVGRDWIAALWERVQGFLDRRARPLPLFCGLTLVLAALSGWRQGNAWQILLYWLVGFFHIGLHELGHLTAVRGVRYTPRRLIMGPLTVEWEDGRRAVAATRDWRWLFKGNVWFSSRWRTRGRDLAVCVAGPLANLFAVAAVLAVDRALGDAGYFGVYVRANVTCAAVVLLVNLLPLPRNAEGYATDGRQILDLLRGRRIA
ncbi:MAG TPA: hypothetical protein VIJ26_11875 [Thermoanaerobaculia bacterium]